MHLILDLILFLPSSPLHIKSHPNSQDKHQADIHFFLYMTRWRTENGKLIRFALDVTIFVEPLIWGLLKKLLHKKKAK
jgi:hypothetical protein